MQFRYVAAFALCVMMVCGLVPSVMGQETGRAQSDASPAQRLEIMRSRLEAMRRSLSGAISSVNAKDTGEKKDGKATTPADDPRERLRGLEKEVDSILSDVSDARGKQERSERLEAGLLEKLETSVADLETRVQAGLRATADERGAGRVASASNKKKKSGFFGRLLGRGGDNKYEELTGTVAPGRDRELFEEAARQVRKGQHETGRYLFSTIINTYPDSPYLPLAKLAIADSFYLEGTTSALIQAATAYQDWLTFFPTDPLADDVMLKMAEAEMRQMGLANRDVTRARKAEQRLKVILQQFPNTSLRRDVQLRLNEVQENLAMHNLQIGNFYKARSIQGKGGLKGAQSRFREIVEKYPNFSFMDEVLYNLGYTYLQEEEPDEAAKFFQQIVRDYPNCNYAEKAREQLGVIGAPVPDPDPIKAKIPCAQHPGLTERLISEILGTTPVTINKDGILISRDNKGGDLIDIAIQRGGQLPTIATTPTAPVDRRPPAQNRVQPAVPPSQPATAAPNTQTGGTNGGSGIKLQPTQTGRPLDNTNPAAPLPTPGTSAPPAPAPANGPAPASPTGTRP